ncbi:hypothetical protein OAI80_00310 [Paracoccaceae bacterium]|nr:hypothetical protein [Paracoccaceae bacterium]
MRENYKPLSYQDKIDLSKLNAEKTIKFDMIFSQEDLLQISNDLDLESIKKTKLRGEISKINKDKWTLRAVMGATILQKSVLSLKPVTTRIDDKITRQIVKGPDLSIQKSELELNDDDFIDKELHLGNIFFECLALAVPTYPKEPNEIFENISLAQKAAEIPSNDETSPFAILSALKKKDTDI